MAVEVYVSVILREICAEKSQWSVEAKTVREIIEKIEIDCPGFGNKVLTSEGLIQKSILVSVNGKTVSSYGICTAVESGDKVYFLVAFAGG